STAPTASLCAVTVKTSEVGPANVGTMGAVKVCTEPSAAAGVRMIPAGATQVKVTLPPAGEIAVAVRGTAAPLATGFAGAELAVTAIGVFAGAVPMGIITFANPATVVLLPPTRRRKVSVVGEATTGATNVAIGEVGLVMVTIGWPGVTNCSQKKGPLTGL